VESKISRGRGGGYQAFEGHHVQISPEWENDQNFSRRLEAIDPIHVLFNPLS
jgi:hypothetical protein